MTERIKSGLTARNQAHAAEQIAAKVKECLDGVSDEEARCVAHARVWGLDEDQVIADFADVRAVRARQTALEPELKEEKLTAPLHRKRIDVAAYNGTKKIFAALQPAQEAKLEPATEAQPKPAEVEAEGATALVSIPPQPLVRGEIILPVQQKHCNKSNC